MLINVHVCVHCLKDKSFFFIRLNFKETYVRIKKSIVLFLQETRNSSKSFLFNIYSCINKEHAPLNQSDLNFIRLWKNSALENHKKKLKFIFFHGLVKLSRY